MHAIEIQNVEKQVDDFQLGPINLKMEPNMITALVGNNAPGKSTLIKMIMNLVKQDRGDVNIFDTLNNENDESWKEKIAYQPQTTIGYDPFNGKALRDLISQWYSNWDEQLFQEIIHSF